jgi:transposase
VAVSSQIPAQTIGIDVSDRFTSYCILDGEGEIVEEGKVRTTPEAFERRFGGVDPCRVVMEVGTHSPWASRKLAECGHEVIVANPWKVRLIALRSRRRTVLTPRLWHAWDGWIPRS